MENVCTISLVYYDISTKKVRREVVMLIDNESVST